MKANTLVVIAACVLIQAPLRDTMLRLAEAPSLYLPRWSAHIIDEMVRNLEGRMGLSPHRTAYLVSELERHFEESWVTGYQPLINRMANHPKDRHVLAAAVRCRAKAIVTFNRKDFPVATTEPWEVEVLGPSTFLERLYQLSSSTVLDRLHQQADNLGRTLPQQLSVLGKAVPAFVEIVRKDLGLSEQL